MVFSLQVLGAPAKLVGAPSSILCIVCEGFDTFIFLIIYLFAILVVWLTNQHALCTCFVHLRFLHTPISILMLIPSTFDLEMANDLIIN